MHYVTVQKHYLSFRQELALESDTLYQKNADRVTEYDEYLYLPKSLKSKKNIHKAQHFLTLSYDEKIYTIMMPKTNRYSIEGSTEYENALLVKYLTFNKIAKLSKIENTITDFWNYFENFILQYKGVSDKQFIFYLKEAEWRFNQKIK
ncbi:MAG: hypothetical protein COB42_06305 [Sulfurimonas sp.]|nr:MAG: hypothetical protein COB42_06305 [Sulfurimonas sp.]